MRSSLTALTFIALLVVACSRPDAAPPSLPGPEPQAPIQLNQETPAENHTSAEEVHRLLGEISELRRQEGTGIEIRTRIDQARSEAGHDAQLLTEIAWIALDVNYDAGWQAAFDAVQADEAYWPAHVALGAALYANRRYEDSRVHLERAYEETGRSLEAGYQLALTLEAGRKGAGSVGGGNQPLPPAIRETGRSSQASPRFSPRGPNDYWMIRK